MLKLCAGIWCWPEESGEGRSSSFFYLRRAPTLWIPRYILLVWYIDYIYSLQLKYRGKYLIDFFLKQVGMVSYGSVVTRASKTF